MKCSNAREEIERLVYEGIPYSSDETDLHVNTCPLCSRHLEEIRMVAGKIATLRRREPVLEDPAGLTESIMNSIGDGSAGNLLQTIPKTGKLPAIIIMQRLLAAASVLLILLFGYEQYVVVDKIGRLEKQNAAVSKSEEYRTALVLSKAIRMISSDPALINSSKEYKKTKLDPRTLLKAIMYVDESGMAPHAFKLENMTGHTAAAAPLLSVLKNFDSTHQFLQK